VGSVPLLTAWVPTWLGLGVPALLAAAYLVGVVALRTRGAAWPTWRLVLWMVTVVLAAWTFAGAPYAMRAHEAMMDGVAIGFAAAVLPLGLALGDPVELIERLRGRRIGWIRGRIARFVMLPGVSSLVAMVFLTATITSHWWYTPGATPGLPWSLLLTGAVLTGLLVNLPLLADDLLPPWATAPIRVLIAFVDGIFDAVPGIVMMLTISWWTGGALLAVAEAIGIPMIAATLVRWVRADKVETELVDAKLDAAQAAAADNPESGDDGLWWKHDPRFADRYSQGGDAT
jgi:putative copper resistance protein D